MYRNGRKIMMFVLAVTLMFSLGSPSYGAKQVVVCNWGGNAARLKKSAFTIPSKKRRDKSHHDFPS